MTRSQWLFCHLYPELRVETPEGEGALVGVGLESIEVYIRGSHFDFDFNECKPKPRDLSTMTEEEKREFEGANGYRDSADMYPLCFDCNMVMDSNGDPMFEPREIFWLLEHGFYVGQCPREECVVE